MFPKNMFRKSLRHLRAAFVTSIVFQLALGGPLAASLQAQQAPQTRTPIKHVIVIIGENRTFDHIFATYKPKKGEKVDNLLSKEIINADGTPGPNYSLAEQFSAQDTSSQGYQVSPMGKTVYSVLPVPLVGGPTNAPLSSVTQAEQVENGLASEYYVDLTTGGTGLTAKTPDTRIPNVNNLPPGPFQLSSSTFPYDGYAASPVHRFYEMWQQLDCNYSVYSTIWDASGCKADLFPWVEVTIGAGSNGLPQPAGLNNLSTGEGGTGMGFYNVLQGDAPYLKALADQYAMSDNFHQSVMGGTGANHVMLGTGDAIWFSDGNGNPAVPPSNQIVRSGTELQGTVDEIENPNAVPGTNNWYTEDGYGGGGPSGVLGTPGKAVYGGGTYSNCSDSDAPGVFAVLNYLSTLPYEIDPKCEPSHYYLLNNYNPNPTLWQDTAIFVTFDEGGGYYDSGYVQPLDFFGDGTRIPMIVVSPYTKAGHISHDYTDHVSILKFIERNWGLEPLTKRSRDNLPNPKYNKRDSVYMPVNGPAIGDLLDFFNFAQ